MSDDARWTLIAQAAERLSDEQIERIRQARCTGKGPRDWQSRDRVPGPIRHLTPEEIESRRVQAPAYARRPTWSRDLGNATGAREVDCPSCGARVGQSCRDGGMLTDRYCAARGLAGPRALASCLPPEGGR